MSITDITFFPELRVGGRNYRKMTDGRDNENLWSARGIKRSKTHYDARNKAEFSIVYRGEQDRYFGGFELV